MKMKHFFFLEQIINNCWQIFYETKTQLLVDTIFWIEQIEDETLIVKHLLRVKIEKKVDILKQNSWVENREKSEKKVRAVKTNSFEVKLIYFKQRVEIKRNLHHLEIFSEKYGNFRIETFCKQYTFTWGMRKDNNSSWR